MYHSLSLPSRHIWNCHFPQRGGSWGLGWRGNLKAQTSKTCNTLTFFCDQVIVGFAANFLHLSTTLWIGSGRPFTCIYSNGCGLDFSLRTRPVTSRGWKQIFYMSTYFLPWCDPGIIGGGGASHRFMPPPMTLGQRPIMWVMG